MFRQFYIPIFFALMLSGVNAEAQANRPENHRFKFDGVSRNYLSYVPKFATSLPGKRPLVLVLHGGGGTAAQIARGTRRRFDQLADAHGFYVVYPNADAKIWDTGEGIISTQLDRRQDDLKYFETVISQMQARHAIDPARIFVAGISRGGQAAYMLACNAPGRIRAMAVIAMTLPAYARDNCRNTPATGLALFHGTEDPIVPYDGGRITLGRQARDTVLSIDQTLKIWRNRNRCSDVASVTQIDLKRDGTSVEKVSWQCNAAPVTLYRIIGGGHNWPSGRSVLPARFVGRTTQDINAADAAWALFARYK